MDQPLSPTDRKEVVEVIQAKLSSLKKLISETIASYKSKRKRNKIGAIAVQSLSILFSFGTTVLIGLKLVDTAGESIDISNFALVISALATGIVALDKFFDYKALWIGYNVSIANLKSLDKKLEYLSSGGAKSVPLRDLDNMFEQFELICSNMNRTYQEIRMSKDE